MLIIGIKCGKVNKKYLKMWKTFQFYVDKSLKMCYTISVFSEKTKKRDTHYMKNTLDKF